MVKRGGIQIDLDFTTGIIDLELITGKNDFHNAFVTTHLMKRRSDSR
jgi:hypothetical protein